MKGSSQAGPPIIRVRRAGTVYIVLTILLGVVAVNSGNNLLYLLTTLLLGYMLASGVAGRRNIMRARAAMEFPDEIYAGRPFQATVRVGNSGRASLHMIDVVLRVEGDGRETPQGVFFGLILPGETQSREIVMTLPRRGNARVALEISSAYPFDFFVRYGWELLWVGALVFPAPLYEDPALSQGGEEDGEDEEDAGAAAPGPDASNVAGIRPYQPGDPVNRVHWKISARTGKLNTRLFDASSNRAVTIDLDELVSHGLEHGLSVAAGRIVAAGREGTPVGMRDRGTTIPPALTRGDRLSLLERLALYEFRGEVSR